MAFASSMPRDATSHPAAQKWDFDWGYSGISTFGHLPHERCLADPSIPFDIAVLGIPFDTAASYRPGARFGPRAIRAASNRHLPSRGFSPYAGVNPYMSWARVLDCGDIPVTPFDNELALKQMTEALQELGERSATNSKDGQPPKLILLGGDHSIALPALRALKSAYRQPIAVVHFDAHLDTLHPNSYPSVWSSPQSDFTHGSMFWLATKEGLIQNGTSVHAGLRTRLTGAGWDDYQRDDEQGFLRLTTEDIDEIGPQGIVDKIIRRTGTEHPVYLSFDIDVLDPGIAPGTGAPEPGGWTMREVNRILRGLRPLNIVGADIVEVSPAYDDKGESTAFAAAQIAYELITNWVLSGSDTDRNHGTVTTIHWQLRET
ncbi:arginase family-domain-containing protein [Aspergillus pseudotamarii]|uniref:Arginase family-domain-containing protein n=1 Tax=Aspergillus pseudotamarii TaxID=132259 RepID=A0A5N6SS25_ASPPS|nr:arginase family-domain-containing protein [Aspergillus pseudotamarii]KAE8137425.1 arginase family-domain-containing protein [Aspergillus pseudotamarii]